MQTVLKELRLTLALALPMMRVLKAALAALQFRHRASEMGL